MSATLASFVAGALGSVGLVLLAPLDRVSRFGSRAGDRVDEHDDRGDPERVRRGGPLHGRRAGLGATAVHLLAALGRRLAPAARLAAPKDLERRIAAAGLAGAVPGPLAGLDARELMAAKLAGAAVGAGWGMAVGTVAPGRLGVVLVLAGPVVGFMLPDLWLVRRARARARAVRRELPALLDLLRVTVDAGLPLTAALRAVGERTRGVLGAEWRVVGREVTLGVPLVESLRTMTERVPLPELLSLIRALDRSARHGAPLAETLAAQAREARAARGRRIREEAARAGPKIQLVVALLLVPSVLLLVAAALAAALIGGGGLPV